MEFTERANRIIALIERQSGSKIGTREERIAGFKAMTRVKLVNFRRGIEGALFNRMNLDNADSFESEEQRVKTQILEENLEIVDGILAGTL